MENDPGSRSAPVSSEVAGRRHRTGVPTSGLSAQHQPRQYATVLPTESFEIPFQIGEVLGGKYRVLELLGVGGVGFVIAATHLGLDSTVALKFLKPEFVSNKEALRSFTLEAGASFKIHSEHVVRVHDVDVLPNGMPFIVMELLRGRDLRRLLQRQRTLTVERAVDFAMQGCEALAAAHALQIVHRDVKPENLFIIDSDDSGFVKMLDFGIARVSAATNSFGGITPSMVAVGTPPYMSPEQIRGSRHLDARTDQWSLGCVLYELLTGTSPFARPSIMQSCAAVLEDEAAPLREARPDLPKELEHVVMRCLRKSAAERFRDVAELAVALAPFSKHYAYYAARCSWLLTERPAQASALTNRRSEPPSAAAHATSMRARTSPRLPTGSVPTGALPTGSVPSGAFGAEGRPVQRLPTLNPPPPPAGFASNPPARRFETRPPLARQQSNLAVPVVPVAAAAVDLSIETTDVGDIPGLRPGRTRLFFVVAAATSIAIAVAYAWT